MLSGDPARPGDRRLVTGGAARRVLAWHQVEEDLAWGVVQHEVGSTAEHEVADATLARRAQYDDLAAAVDGLLDDRPPRLARRHDVRRELDLELLRDESGGFEYLGRLGAFVDQVRIERQVERHLAHEDGREGRRAREHAGRHRLP